MVISLCGFMGAGKSTIGKHLANWLGFRFTDLDTYIEQRSGCSVSRFFAANGEERFRDEEYNALVELLGENKRDMILALGGGTLIKPECRELLCKKSLVIYLYCNEEQLYKRLLKGREKRPLLSGKSDEEMKIHIGELIASRKELYKASAHITVDTSKWSVTRIIKDISDRLPPYEGDESCR